MVMVIVQNNYQQITRKYTLKSFRQFLSVAIILRNTDRVHLKY